MKVTIKMTIGILVISLTGFFMFSQFARNSGRQMMEKHASEESRVYAQIISNYLKHTMLEHAEGGSLFHFDHVFNEVFAVGDNYFTNSELFMIHEFGEVKVNQTSDSSFARISSDQIEELRTLEMDETSLVIPGFAAEFSVFRINNDPKCQNCHNSDSRTRGYIGVSSPVNSLLNLAEGHSSKNYMWMALIVVIVAGGIIVLTLKLVINPVRQLDDEMGNLSDELKLRDDEWERFAMINVRQTKDEINNLGDRINFLLENLNRARRALKSTHDKNLEEANRLVSTAEMAASLAHEIKNPLAGVMGALEVIYQKTPQENEFRGTIAEVNRQLLRINHTLDDLLVFARPSKPSFIGLDINGVIRSTLVMLRAHPSTSSIDFEFKTSHEKQLINGDSKQINQVFWNVLSNATQSMRDGGVLSINVDQIDDHIKVVIRDDGEGIKPEDLSQIFNSFFTTKSKGTGLGLAVTKQILDTHLADIDISSTYGEGTNVTITFLRVEAS